MGKNKESQDSLLKDPAIKAALQVDWVLRTGDPTLIGGALSRLGDISASNRGNPSQAELDWILSRPLGSDEW